MKRALWIISLFAVLLTASPAWSFSPAIEAVLSAGGAVVNTDSCTGGLIFSWHCENTDVTLGGIAGGVNNGCSVGDTTATGAGTNYELNASVYKDGIKGCHFPNRNSSYQFAISSEDIIKHTAGTWKGWVYVDTFVSAAAFTYTAVDTNNWVKIIMQTATTSQFRISHKAGGTERTATTTITGGLSEDTWYYVVAKWDETVHGTEYLSICADTTNGTTNCSTAGTVALGSWSGTLSTLVIGEPNLVTGPAVYLDQVKIYSSWQ